MTPASQAADSATTFTIMRHGQTDWNLAGRMQGTSDIPLNDTGRAQVAEAAEKLVGTPFAVVFASGLSRAQESAQIVCDRLGIGPVLTLPGIQERHYGDAEGKVGKEILAEYGSYRDIPTAETPAEVVERASKALFETAAAYPGQQIFMVSHGAVINHLIRFINNDPEGFVHTDNAQFRRFRCQDGQLELLDPIEEGEE